MFCNALWLRERNVIHLWFETLCFLPGLYVLCMIVVCLPDSCLSMCTISRYLRSTLRSLDLSMEGKKQNLIFYKLTNLFKLFRTVVSELWRRSWPGVVFATGQTCHVFHLPVGFGLFTISVSIFLNWVSGVSLTLFEVFVFVKCQCWFYSDFPTGFRRGWMWASSPPSACQIVVLSASPEVFEPILGWELHRKRGVLMMEDFSIRRTSPGQLELP